MSETTTAAAPVVAAETTTAAPQVTETALAAEQATTETRAPLGRNDVRRSVMEKVRAASAAREAASAPAENAGGGSQTSGAAGAASLPKIDATGRAHDPSNGQFTTPPADAGGVAPPATTQVDPAGTAATETPQATTRRIDIPNDHPLRGMGLDAFDALNEQQERGLRALLNGTYTRTQEVAAMREQMARLQDEHLRLQAQLATRDTWNTQVVDDGTLAQYEALKSVDESVANAFLRGKQAELEEKANEKYAELAAAEQEKALTQYASEAEQRIRTDAVRHISATWPKEVTGLPFIGEIFTMAEAKAEAALSFLAQNNRLPDDLTEREEVAKRVLVQEMGAAVTADPRTRAVLGQITQQRTQAQQEAERQRIEAEAQRTAEARAAEAEQQRFLEAAQRPVNPMGQIPSQVRTGQQTNGEQKDELAGLTGLSLRKAIIRRAVARASAAA